MTNKENNKKEDWQVHILFLKNIAEQKDISKYQLAKITGYSESTIGRIFKLMFCPKLKIVVEIAKALDIKMELHSI